MTLSSSTVFCSLVVVVAAFTGSVSALSCAQCQPEQIAKVSIYTCTCVVSEVTWLSCLF